jgi:hypothetical protein
VRTETSSSESDTAKVAKSSRFANATLIVCDSFPISRLQSAIEGRPTFQDQHLPKSASQFIATEMNDYNQYPMLLK